VQRASGKGRMLDAATTPDAASHIIAAYVGRVCIASFNSPISVTLSGDADALENIAAHLGREQLSCRFLDVTVPYHGPAMDPFRDELLVSLASLSPDTPAIPIVSTGSGTWASSARFDGEHWWNTMRNPVRFAGVIETLIESGYDLFLEISPHPLLGISINETLVQLKRPGAVLASLHRRKDERSVMSQALAALHVHGRRVDWEAVFGSRRACVSLPTYPWQRETYRAATAPSAGDEATRPAGSTADILYSVPASVPPIPTGRPI